MHPIANVSQKPFHINVNLKHFIQFIYVFFRSSLIDVVAILAAAVCYWLLLLLYDFCLFCIWFDCVQTIYLLTLIVHCRFMIIDKIYFEGCACYQKKKIRSYSHFTHFTIRTHAHTHTYNNTIRANSAPNKLSVPNWITFNWIQITAYAICGLLLVYYLFICSSFTSIFIFWIV